MPNPLLRKSSVFPPKFHSAISNFANDDEILFVEANLRFLPIRQLSFHIAWKLDTGFTAGVENPYEDVCVVLSNLDRGPFTVNLDILLGKDAKSVEPEDGVKQNDWSSQNQQPATNRHAFTNVGFGRSWNVIVRDIHKFALFQGNRIFGNDCIGSTRNVENRQHPPGISPSGGFLETLTLECRAISTLFSLLCITWSVSRTNLDSSMEMSIHSISTLRENCKKTK